MNNSESNKPTDVAAEAQGSAANSEVSARESAIEKGPGQVLASAREELEATSADIAKALNLSVRTVDAIESHDLANLPGQAYINGYLRSYAKIVGLASEPLIEAWHAHLERSDTPQIPGNGARPVNSAGRPRFGLWAGIAIVLALGYILFAVNYFQPVDVGSGPEIALPGGRLDTADRQYTQRDQPPTAEARVLAKATATPANRLVPESKGDSASTLDLSAEAERTAEADVANQSAPVPTPETVAQADSKLVEPLAQQVATEPPEPAASSPAAFANDVVDTEAKPNDRVLEVVSATIVGDSVEFAPEFAPEFSGEVETRSTNELAELAAQRAAGDAPERALAYALPQLTEFGDDEIFLEFFEDCWFEIRNDTGQLLYADLGREGQTRRYTGQSPFQIKLGNSLGVDMQFNAETISLGPFTRKNIARLTLGDDN